MATDALALRTGGRPARHERRDDGHRHGAEFLGFGPFYDIGNSMLHMANMASMTPTTLNPFADQQIGAAILWVCGDFWCYPALVMALRLATKNDANSSAMDQVLRVGDR